MTKKTKNKIETQNVAIEVPVELTSVPAEIANGSILKITEYGDEKFAGSIVVPRPGEYWLYAFIKKDNDKVSLSLVAEYKPVQPELHVIVQERGVLFRNNRKRTRNQADYNGNIYFGSAGEFQLDGEIKESKQKTKYMDLVISDKSESNVSWEDVGF